MLDVFFALGQIASLAALIYGGYLYLTNSEAGELVRPPRLRHKPYLFDSLSSLASQPGV